MTQISDSQAPRLLLIDDDKGQLGALEAAIRERLGGIEAVIDVWQPQIGEGVRNTLIEKLEPRPTLVVTDHDLTENGAAGLLGGSVISWCRAHAIPVGDYSRKLAEDLEEPDLFEFRFPGDATEAAVQIADLLLGFRDLAGLLEKKPEGEADGWSHTLATILEHPESASSFSLYSVRAGASHVTAIERLEKIYGEDSARRLLETYVIGHLLHNGILRYPGPILSDKVLCSYIAVDDNNIEGVAKLFEEARYRGPFGRSDRFYWQDAVDDVLVDLADKAKVDGEPGDDQFRRRVMSEYLGVGVHACPHCGGNRGGFRCPYTDRTTCDRADCSVPTTSWIPQGAYLCRVDKEYYERWSPLLGM